MTKQNRRSRQKAEIRGRRAETFAALILRAKFYTILDRRVRFPSGEIDLIAKRGSVLAFVEVKQRPTVEQCQTSVHDRNWSRIASAAERWSAQRPQFSDCNWRYDLIAITPAGWPRHLRDFWRP
ncbi:MAG: YraN family protein [Pseudomonadota bacterium]